MTDWAGLREAGEVLRPGDDGYEVLRAKYVGVEPDAFVKPGDAGEIAVALKFARGAGIAVSIRSGGHGAAIFPNPGGLVIDLARLDTVEVGDGGRVRVGAGVTWGVVAEALAARGLGLSSGDTRQVGVGGLTLGGGIGWMVRQYGLALDSLIEVDLVTASGERVRASGRENPELFWALRGGGGNFGIVTHFTFQAHALTGVVAGSIPLDVADLAATIRGWRTLMRVAPERLNVTLMVFPPMGEGMPVGGQLLVCYAGEDGEDARAAIDPLLTLPGAGAADIAAKRYPDALEDAVPPPPLTIVGDNGFVPDFSDAAIDAIVAVRDELTPAVLMIRALGGAYSRVPADATAFAFRTAEAWVYLAGLLAPDADAAAIESAQRAWDALRPYTVGTYGNFHLTTDPQTVERMYPPLTYERLLDVKRTWDPDNVFRVNHNLLIAQ